MKNVLFRSSKPVCIVDANGETVEVSENWKKVFAPYSNHSDEPSFRYFRLETELDVLTYLQQSAQGEVVTSPAIHFLDESFHHAWFEFTFLPTVDQENHFLVIANEVSIRERNTDFLRKINEISQLGYWEVNTQNNEIYWDEQTYRIHDAPLDFIPTYDNTFQFFKGEFSDRIKKYMREAFIYGIPYDEELEIVTLQGQTVPVRTIGKPEFHDGNCIRIYGTMQVIRDQVVLKRKLEKSKKTFQDAFHYSGIGMAIVAPNGKWLNVNKKLQEILGFTEEELAMLSFQDITYFEDLDTDLVLLDQLVRGEIDSYEMKKRYHHKQGHLVWAKLSVSVVRNDDGTVQHFISQIQDITLEMEYEKEIEQQKEKFWSVFNSSYQFTALLGIHGELLEINEAALKFGNVERSSVMGVHLWKTYWWSFDELAAEKLAKNIERAASGSVVRYDAKVMGHEREPITVDFSLKPIYDNDAKLRYILAEARIIEDYIQALKKVSESEAKFRTLFELSPVGFILSDFTTGEIKDINQSIVNNTQYSRETFLGMKFRDLVPREHYPTLARMEEELAEKGYFDSLEIDYFTHNNSTFPAIVDGVLTVDKRGNKLVWSVVQNISELKENQARLQQLNEEIHEKNVRLFRSNEELEQFANIASHDLQEPLRMISSFIGLIDSKYGHHFDEKGKKYLEFVSNGATRMRLLIHNLLAYSKVSNDFSAAESVDLMDLFREIQGLIQRSSLEVHDLPVIVGQRTPLFHLFKNVVQNGFKYQKPDSTPKVEVACVESEDSIVISVKDNGIGIPLEAQDRIFDLFSRAHNPMEYEGSGIGLALCKKIMERHNGKIWVESTPEVGSIFYCSFPKK